MRLGRVGERAGVIGGWAAQQPVTGVVEVAV
jgi:hypothetical protein